MVQTVPTGRDGEIREVRPERCPRGHRLLGGKVLIGYSSHPAQPGRARWWQCRTCGETLWDEAATPGDARGAAALGG